MSKTTASTATSPSDLISNSPTKPTIISKDLPQEYANALRDGLISIGVSASFPHKQCTSADFYSHLLRGLLHVSHLDRGRVSCFFSILPAFTNYFNGLHGGAVAAISERVSIACARTVVAQDSDLFLGELGISYLSAASQNEELMVDASVVRSGRNLTVVAIEFRIKKTRKLVYTARATFYNMPIAKL